MLDIIVGTAPVNWNNRDVPALYPSTPYARMLDEMAAAGYAGTEFGEEFPPDPAEIQRDLDARGLRPASTFCALNLRDPARREAELARATELAGVVRALGGDILIVADDGDERRRAVAGRVDATVALDEATWASVVAGLTDLAGRCAPLDVHLALHNHVGTYIETEEELSRLLDSAGPAVLGLCLDVGHLAYAGGDVQRVTARYADRITYVHLKDVNPAVLARSRREGLGFAAALTHGIFPELGAGIVDFDAFLGALDAHDYRGWLIVEQDTTTRTPFESARRNRDYLRDRFGL